MPRPVDSHAGFSPAEGASAVTDTAAVVGVPAAVRRSARLATGAAVARGRREQTRSRPRALGAVPGPAPPSPRPARLEAHLLDLRTRAEVLELADDGSEIRSLGGELARRGEGLQQVAGAAVAEL